MRPAILWTCLCLVEACMQFCAPLAQPLSAQTQTQPPTQPSRPSTLRDAGIINRAPQPMSLEGNPTSSAFSDRAWTGGPAPSSQSVQPSQSSPAMPPGSAPSAAASSSASARLSDSSDTLPVSSPAMPTVTSPYASGVAPAQYTSPEARTSTNLSAASFPQNQTASQPTTPNNLSGQNQQASFQAKVGMQGTVEGAAAHEPRPLKPPSSAETKINGKGSTGTVQMFVSVLSSLAIVIGLMLAAAWFYRKAAPTISGALPKQVVQVLGRTPLAPRQQLVLLRLGSKLVLVSNLHGEVRAISEITDPLEVDRLAGLCEAAQPGSISESFRSVLHNIGRNG